jgi:hypothetical protein
MNNRFLKNSRRTMATYAVAIALIAFSFVNPREAEAQSILGIPVTDVNNIIQTTLSALSAAALEQKELVLDGLFYDIATQALQQMTSDMLEWVNSGFDGEPRFVTDLRQYLEDIDKDAATDFVYTDQFSKACTPIQLNARKAIATIVQNEAEPFDNFKEEAACTIDKIPGGNPEAFLSGDFSAGGWSMWFETVINPQNTPIGLEIKALDALRKEQQERRDEEQKKLDWGDGFKSQEVCTTPAGVGEPRCVITTPGVLIKDQVSLALQAPMLRLIGADEMNEIIGSLFSNLAQQAMQGVNGLLGLGGNSLYASIGFGAEGEESYLDAVRKEQGGGSVGGGNKIEEALRIETQVLQLQLGIAKEITDIGKAFIAAEEPFEGDSCWDLELPEEFEDQLDSLTKKVPATVKTVATLTEMVEAYKKADSSQEQMEILQQLSKMQSSGTLSGRTAAIQYENYLRNELLPAIEEFEEDIKDQEDAC